MRSETSPRTRRAARLAARSVGVALFVSLLPTVAGAQPIERTQSIGTLQERAAEIAAELDTLDRRTNELDEQFNDASLALDDLRTKLAANQAEVDAATASLTSNRDVAEKFAIEAYVGGATTDDLTALSDDVLDESRRRTYLSSQYGDREDVIDDLRAAKKDLADREAKLQAQQAEVDAKAADIEASRQQLTDTIAQRQQLQASVQGELADALKAEQERLAREAAAKAQAEAEAAAARAAAARRPAAVAVQNRATASGTTAAATVVVQDPPASSSNARPTPAGAPTAVSVAMEQQGKPYKWAAAGPNAFDCSGLVMFAYGKAGVSLPHSSRALKSQSQSISADELQPGDLVFGGSPVHHVGIYIGNGEMVHAPHSGDVVKVSGIYSTSKPVTFGRL